MMVLFFLVAWRHEKPRVAERKTPVFESRRAPARFASWPVTAAGRKKNAPADSADALLGIPGGGGPI
jgi:hypothetical protein